MRILNLQDGVVKSSLVQQAQQRPAEVARVQDAANVAQNQELARQADEVVIETNQAEHDPIREEQERREREKERRRRRRRRPATQEKTTAANEKNHPPPRPGGLDITV